jgi:hypothetical protein
VAAARKASRYFRSAICQHSASPRCQITTIYAMQSLLTTPPVRAGSRRPPHRPPRVYSVRQRFSAPAHSTRGGQIVCGGLPAISAFQHHSTHHPSIVGPLPVFSCSCSRPFRLCSTHWVWRLRLRPPTHPRYGPPPPHVHSSCLAPVSFAGFLIKCLHVHWHPLGFRPKVMPPCRFAWPFSRRLGYILPWGC